MKRLFHYLVSALAGFFFIPFLGFSQDIHFDLVTRSKDDNNNPVRAITQDKQGYLWFGTTNGLFKYDGYQYTTYQPQPLNPNSLALSGIECLGADKDGYIWIGHYFGAAGLERLDPATGIFTHFRHQPNDPSSLASDSVLVIIQGTDGTIWVGTNGGLDRFDSKTNKFFHYQNNPNDPASLSSNQVRTVYEDKQGTIWVGTGNPFRNQNPLNEGGLNKLDKKTGKFTRYLHNDKDPQSLIDSRVTSIFEDSRGNFWVGTVGDGLHKMDRAKGSFERLTNDPSHPEKISRSPVHESFSFFTDHITFITEDIKGRIWIGSMIGGINVYDPATQKNALYGSGQNSKEKLKDNNFWKAYTTTDGIIWICSWELNLYKINPYQNKPAHTYVGKGVIDFREDNAHNLMLATTMGLVYNDKNGKQQSWHIDKDSTSFNNFILRIETDKDNRLWLGTFKGLYNFDPGTKNFKAYHHEKGDTNSLTSDTVGSIKKINDNQLWLGTAGGLVLMDTKTGTFKNYQHDAKDSNSISSNEVYTIFVDKNGTVWAGGNRGINRLDQQTGHFKKYFTQLNLNCIMEDSKGVLWAATQAGLFKYDKERDNFLAFSDETRLLNSNTVAYSIAEDHEQNLWINSSNGVIKLSKDGKEAILLGKNQGVDPNTLYGISFTRQNGEILSGDSSGYLTFTNANLLQKTPPSFLNITNFSLANVPVKVSANGVLNKPIEETKEIHLSHDQNTFSFEFTNIDFISAHEDTRLMYMLQNYDNAWQLANGNQAAYYFNLPPGEYILKVKALVNNGSKTEKEILIIITPPWWKTWWAYCIYGLLLIAAAWATHRYQKQRIIRIERERNQKRELAQAKEIEKAYTELKQTQTQLIQSEKMASLGELTAGIAHEIQNPLNFVNNFSEVNIELTDELKVGLNDSALPDEKKTSLINIVDDIAKNQEKINHHGKRADAIVKGMLQHSRTSNGVKEPTNINALADEYLRLSYHGLRAKDKSFNATLKTDFDESIGNINIIPQDIGRVMLNIITNAFYAVNEKQKAESLKLKAQSNNYEPTVSVSTQKMGDSVLIAIKDNGNGIPQKVLDKIFQPFFTTKPTGQGTGLGLSLAYDIVKAHGGEIRIETKEARPPARAGSDGDEPVGRGEGSTFFIQLPVKENS